MSDDSVEAILADLLDMRHRGANPVVRQIAALTFILLDTIGDLAEGNRTEKLYHARIDAAIRSLEQIPDDVWNEWCEIPKEEMVPQIAAIFRKKRLHLR